MRSSATLHRAISNVVTSTTPAGGTPSTVHRGVAFEKRSLRLLAQNLSMSLCRVGGKSDGGIDLQGWWWVPTSTSTSSGLITSSVSVPPFLPGEAGQGDAAWSMPRKRIRILAQCKAEKKKMGPNYVRELEGVLHRHLAGEYPYLTSSSRPPPSASTQDSDSDHDGREVVPIVGALISQSPFTRSTLLRAQSSTIPFLLLHIPPLLELEASSYIDASEEEEEDGSPPRTSASEVGSIIFNNALSSPSGPLNGEVEARWEWSPHAAHGRPGLWWRGRRLLSWVPDPQTFGNRE